MQNIFDILNQKLWPPTQYESAYIEGFKHWYSHENINRIDKTLQTICNNDERSKCLDIGFGNPIVLQRELEIFSCCKGLYITLKKALENGVSASLIHEGNCYQIPFQNEEFDLVSAYAFLHIIPDIPEFYREAFRILRKGGCLYTDGDKNIFLTKIIRRIKMLQFRLLGKKSNFMYWKDLLKEKENFHKEGIDYIELKKILYQIGFKEVLISPWFSSKESLNRNLFFKVTKKLLTYFKINFLFTHIQIVATK